jgi:phenylacetate-coenzyme A ligase PaaK-like adenylate-forming protein
VADLSRWGESRNINLERPRRLASLARRAITAGRFTAVAPLEWRLPFSSPAAIERAQRRQLRATVAHAYEHVPYYRETMPRLGLDPGNFQTAGDLAKLPLIDREQVQHDPEYFVSRAEPLASYSELHTSGSTGEPMAIFRHVPGIFQQALGFERMEPLLARLAGRRWSRRDAVIVPPSGSNNVNGAPQVQWLGLHLRSICRTFSLFDPPAEIAPRIDEFRPHLVRGYGSYIEELYAHLLSEGRSFHRPNGVVYSADPISEPVRRLMREELGIAVLSVYQAVEMGRIGWECERQCGHHLNVDLCPIRILDSDRREVPTGESGQVVGSNLVNRGTVLLNYMLGDLASRLPEPCGCGRSLPLLSHVQGRTTEWLRLASGAPIHPQTMRGILRDVEGVRRYQLVQERPGQVRVVAVTTPEADRNEIRSQVARAARRLPHPIDAEVEFSVTLPRTEGGKVRGILRHEVSLE